MSDTDPRWRLRLPHYLNTKKQAIWRHEETSQASGEKTEVDYPVPRYLDPNDSKQFNSEGDVVVSHGRGIKGDWEFIGDPTPDMEPLNEAAEAISESLRHKWEHPIESLSPVVDTSMLTDLQRENARLRKQLEAKSEAAETGRRV